MQWQRNFKSDYKATLKVIAKHFKSDGKVTIKVMANVFEGLQSNCKAIAY